MRLEEYLKNKYIAGDVSVEYRAFGEIYDNTKAMYYSFNVGEKTYRVFAFISVPKTKKPKSGYPAVVLMHGGNGAAYYEFTQKWAEKGYVAIAPDYNAKCGENLGNRNIANEQGGPVGYGFSGIDTDEPWTFFSTLSSMKAIDALCGMDIVNKNKIFTVGLSWGGVLNFMLMSQDKRVTAGSIIYSAAYAFNGDYGKPILDGMPEDVAKNYFDNIEPTSYLNKITCPVLFTAGTQDHAFKMNNRQYTADKISGKPYYALREDFYHGNFYGFEQNESVEFFDALCGKKAVPQPKAAILGNGMIKVKAFSKDSELKLVYTVKDLDSAKFCKWKAVRIESGDVTQLPENHTAFFVNEKLADGTIWSTKVFFNGSGKRYTTRNGQ